MDNWNILNWWNNNNYRENLFNSYRYSSFQDLNLIEGIDNDVLLVFVLFILITLTFLYYIIKRYVNFV